MTNPPRFEGLAEDKITWYSNEEQQSTCGSLGLAEDKITWHSNSTCIRLCSRHGLEKVKPQGRKWYQMLFHFLKRSKKLNYRVLKNTDRTQSLW